MRWGDSVRVLEGVPRPGARLPGLQRLGIHGKPCAQLADCKTLATSVRAALCAHVRAAVATRGQPYARVDIMSDGLGSAGSMTMTHNNVMRLGAAHHSRP